MLGGPWCPPEVVGAEPEFALLGRMGQARVIRQRLLAWLLGRWAIAPNTTVVVGDAVALR